MKAQIRVTSEVSLALNAKVSVVFPRGNIVDLGLA